MQEAHDRQQNSPAAPIGDGAPSGADILPPPRTFGGVLVRLGPGLIIAGSIVGSGELIATTKVGAESGFWLLWLILIGCLIKVFAQVEIGRYTIVHGKTALAGLNEVPGPRVGRTNWVVWYWLVMTCLSVAQQGGILGGVGQAMMISFPLTEQGRAYNSAQDELTRARVQVAVKQLQEGVASPEVQKIKSSITTLETKVKTIGAPKDVLIWCVIIALPTAVILVLGQYGLIQFLSTALVAGFTFTTVITVILLQMKPTWAISAAELAQGMSFQLPPAPAAASSTFSPMATAMAAFGIIGVGAAELIMYPYWCLEKGYARFTGPRDDSPGWADRARGWMRVMMWDAGLCMIVYTVATLAFYLLGAAVLGRAGLNPSGGDLVRTLSEMYVPVFGTWAPAVFLIGAFAVLYSTFFVACASNARVAADGVRVFSVGGATPAAHQWWVKLLCGLIPLIALGVYWVYPEPGALVMASGAAQAIMLLMLGVAVLWFRYRRSDKRLLSGRLWDALLWISCIGLVIAGLWTLVEQIRKLTG